MLCDRHYFYYRNRTDVVVLDATTQSVYIVLWLNSKALNLRSLLS
ncbi:hypothetical protein HAL013_02980 [Helicobacter ailurogastricus]|uniref:Uncharacterized protein n=1 Tax=Helicobacter ailurogastricus TaxID=1578720 RepID=A0A0K2XAQ2_9HELI|nr:hypothetical protein HAL011_15990 [Helicobacter ailurogastricus]CRF42139.1 hypothetical protein HAL013_02980 [Helicobacter ailurogastricus]CRF43471.1 hypothetical protein HAL09_00120 [Helicobacter ailurogastricus]